MLVADLKRLLPADRHQLVDSLEAEARANWEAQVRYQSAALQTRKPETRKPISDRMRVR